MGERVDPVLEDAIGRWREADLVDDATAVAIRRFEDEREDDDARTDEPPVVRGGLVAEGLAYLGAALAFGAGVALFAEVWVELGGLARTLVAASGTIAIGGATMALGGDASPAVRRLRSLLASLTIVGVALTVGVGSAELTALGDELVALLAGAAALVVAVPVHLARPSWPSALALGASVVTTVLAAEAVVGVVDDEVAIGVTLAALGLAWASLGWAGWLTPRSAFELPGLLAGGIGIQTLAVDAFPIAALVVGLVVAGGVLAVGLLEDRTPPAVVGGLGVTVYAPQLVFEVFGDAVGGPLALLVGGLTMVTVAVLVLRQRRTT